MFIISCQVFGKDNRLQSVDFGCHNYLLKISVNNIFIVEPTFSKLHTYLAPIQYNVCIMKMQPGICSHSVHIHQLCKININFFYILTINIVRYMFYSKLKRTIITTIIYVAGKVQSTRCMVLKILTNEYVNIFKPLNMFSVAYITVLARRLGQPQSCHCRSQ